MRLEAFITDLLYDHDCVIIPGFGGLVATYRPARLNRITHVIKPPSKHVGFNRNLTHNDGLLAAHVARITGKAYSEALAEMEETIAEFYHQLLHGQRVSWEKIGLFFTDRSGSLQFIPEEQENFLLESYGLTSVQLRPVAQQTADSPAASERNLIPTDSSSVWWKAAAAVAIPLVAAGVWMLSQNLKPMEGLNLAEINPFKAKTNAAKYTPVVRRVVFSPWDTTDASNWESLVDRPGTRINLITGEEDARGIEITERPAPEKIKPVKKSRTSQSFPRFLIIGGAFEIEENADLFIEQLTSEGYKPFRAGKRGRLHLVAIAGSDSSSEARQFMKEIKSAKQTSAWMLSR